MNRKLSIIIIVVILAVGGAYWVSRQGVREVGKSTNISNIVINGPIGVATGASGKYLTDTRSMTLYVNVKDEGQTKDIKASCNTECEKTWLPYIFDETSPILLKPTDPVSSQINIFVRIDGRRQYALGTKPLYRHISDLNPGDINGDTGADWMVARSFNRP